jgi:hypothetical protein
MDGVASAEVEQLRAFASDRGHTLHELALA